MFWGEVRTALGAADGQAILASVQATESQAVKPPHMAADPREAHRIQPSRWLVPVDFRELWHYRELMRFFILRDLKSRYRQTYLGVSWAILKPFITMIVFSAIFGGLAGFKSGTTIPYPLWVTPAVLLFGYVTSSVNNTSLSLVGNSNLIRKVYFPRLYVPFATAVTPIVDFLLGLLVLLGLFAYFDRAPSWRVVFLPAFVLLAVLVLSGTGLWLSAFTARYRDLIIGVPFLAQIWQYLTPGIYPVSYVPPAYRWLLDLNPLTAVVAGFRWSLLGLPFGSMTALAASLCIGVGAAASGLFLFRRTERFMVDLL